MSLILEMSYKILHFQLFVGITHILSRLAVVLSHMQQYFSYIVTGQLSIFQI